MGVENDGMNNVQVVEDGSDPEEMVLNAISSIFSSYVTTRGQPLLNDAVSMGRIGVHRRGLDEGLLM